jgi:hypothetical protein
MTPARPSEQEIRHGESHWSMPSSGELNPGLLLLYDKRPHFISFISRRAGAPQISRKNGEVHGRFLMTPPQACLLLEWAGSEMKNRCP